MYDALAIKIFAAVNGVTEDAASKMMYHFGFGPEYLVLAEKLQPVFNEAYHDGIVRGAEIMTHIVSDIEQAEIIIKSPNHGEGVVDALDGVREIAKIELALLKQARKDHNETVTVLFVAPER